MGKDRKIDLVILGLLIHEDLTGYDIKKKIDSVNAELAKPEDPEIAASVSVGVAFGGDDVSIRTVFKRADNALYEVKREGGGDCRFAE